MELLKKTDDIQIFKKRSGRYAVKKAKSFVHGDEKVSILTKEKLIKLPKAKPKQSAPETEKPSAESSDAT